jgi:hypothetical protein
MPGDDGHYVPSREQIAEECAKIRAEWTPEQWAERAGGGELFRIAILHRMNDRNLDRNGDAA